MQPHYDQASHEKATLSIDISPLGFYNEVLLSQILVFI